jgi:exonuclease SbcC
VRILAIRGCNLASLAGEFEIDLAHGPLGVAGVFAIVGPTGAGKSTLLDAMCVALFDRTPRLPGHSRVTVGHGEEDPLALGAQDPRTLLRRGASQGWAEVDFESGDTRRYRARWSVRRARGATDGNLQDQQITLVGLDAASVINERLGGTKTETLKAIHQRLGLTFDQFRRSALLAQGDFAAFLRAEGKDRSELLERMTGTEIYSKLSIAAHARMVIAEQELRERQAAALAIAVLGDPARSEIAAELAIAIAAREAARVRLADAERLAHWRAEAAVRAAALEEAVREHSIADAEARGAEPVRAELGLRRRAEALRPAWDEAVRTERQHTIAAGELAQASEAVHAAEAATAELEQTHARIAELHATIRAARIAANVVEIEAASGRRLARGTAEVAATVQVGAAEAQAHGALEPAMWLVERRALAPQIAAWPELDAKLGQERTLADGIAAAHRVLIDQRAQRGMLAARHAALGEAHKLAQHKLAEAAREAESFVKRKTLSLDAAGRAEDDARTRCAEIERLVAISTGARDAAKILGELASRLVELEQAAAGDVERRTLALRERDTADVRRAERARQVGELRKAAGYEHARAELVDGEACPLCGAEDHPWKGKGAFDELIAGAEAALAAVAAEWDGATKVLAQLDARDAQREAERTRFASTRATAAHNAEALARDWRDQLAALGELILVIDPAAPEAAQLAAERGETARAQLEAARATRSAVVAAAKATADAQARVQVCQANLDHHVAELGEVAAQLATIDAAIERIAGDRDGKLERHGELAREVAAIVARWHAALPAADRIAFGGAADVAGETAASAAERGVGNDHMAVTTAPIAGKRAHAAAPVAVGRTPAAAVARFTGNRGVPRSPRAQSLARAAEVAAEQAGDLAIDRAAEHAATAVALDRTAFANVVQAWRERATVVAHVEAALVAALADLDRAIRAAARSVAETAARHAECGKRSRELAAALASATSALDTARASAGFDREALDRMLSAEPSRVDALAAELEQLDRAVDRARTRIAERRRLVDDHAASRPAIADIGGASGAQATGTADANHANDDGGRSTGANAGGANAARTHGTSGLRAVDDGPRPAGLIDNGSRSEDDGDRVPELAAAVTAADHRAAALAATLAADDDARRRRDEALSTFAAAERAAEIDRVLGQVIGSHDGKLFRSFAQSLTLDQLLSVANSHLEELAPRYQLERVPRHDLELQVIDRDFGGEVRSVQSLSGGESFLVSLALALGLSSMSAHDVRVRTLLIDEGFGTLDPATLDSALAVLDELQATGRQVGVISHVPALLDRVRAHVRVTPRGGGRSEVFVPAS